MSRLTLLWIVFVIACKPNGDRSADDDSSGPDSGAPVVDGPVAADAGVLADAMIGNPTVCEEATLHSDFAWLQANIFTPSCATATCHFGPNGDVGLRLEEGEAYTNLVNKGASTQAGWVRVVPGSPSTSYLVVALGRASGPPPRDGFMPLGADPLCVEKLESIERWIARGAQP
jgi:hypothetical protein